MLEPVQPPQPPTPTAPPDSFVVDPGAVPQPAAAAPPAALDLSWSIANPT
jgi:hypothetical protein